MHAKFIGLMMLGASFSLVSCSGGNTQSGDQAPAEQPTIALDAAGTLAALQATGLPITEIKVLTAETDGNKLLGRPNQYTSKADFVDSRYPGEEGLEVTHTIEVFANEQDAAARQKYVEEVSKGVPFLVQYIYRKGTAVLRLDRALTPDHAKQYSEGLGKLIP